MRDVHQTEVIIGQKTTMTECFNSPERDVVEEESGYWARIIPIWIVATVIILIAIILIPYPHCLHVPDMWYELEDPRLEREDLEGDIHWRAGFTVEKVAVENDLTSWSEFQVHVFTEGDPPASSVSMQ